MQVITVLCVYANKGCKWRGDVTQLPQHAQECDKGRKLTERDQSSTSQ